MLPVLFACAASFPPPPAAEPPRLGVPLAPVVYELAVASFQDSDGDGVGDLDGARMRLDYVASLGVTDVWLLPLGVATDRGGWDAIDPATVDPALGGPEALHRFVVDAHDRGLRVTLDLPVDHLAADAPGFLAAADDPEAPERASFRFAALPGIGAWFPAAGGGWYAAAGGEARPDLDGEGAAARAEVARWIAALGDVGIDGLRLDRLDRLLAEPEALGELTAAGGDGGDGEGNGEERAFAADIHGDAAAWRSAGLTWVGDPGRGVLLRRALDGDPDPLLTRLDEARASGVLDVTVAPLTPTRGPRLPTLLPDPALRRAALVAALLLPGIPRLYYGEELDLADAADPDDAALPPMPWDTSRAAGFSTGRPWMEPDEAYLDGVNVADELADPQSPLRLVKALAELRARSPAARAGAWSPAVASPPGALAWSRSERDEAVLVVVNPGPAAEATVDAPGDWLDLTDALTPVRCTPTCALGRLPHGGYRILARGVDAPRPVPR